MSTKRCEKCGATLPDPARDEISLATCTGCGARYIRLHYADGAFWRRLKWWQRI